MANSNLFNDDLSVDSDDTKFVENAKSGDRDALEKIIRFHQPWIYNIAIRMLFHPQDAEDATQEILIKVVTRLSSFEGKSSFRTWLYRIAINHLLNTRRGRFKDSAINFHYYGEELEKIPDLALSDSDAALPDAKLLETETMLACTTGMLLCLDRDQRLIYILGGILGFSGAIAAEVLEITGDNFRQKLSRARRDLGNFMDNKCGLVNIKNPCRCARKTRGFIEGGHVDPENLLFLGERISTVREAAPRIYGIIETTLDEKCANIYRDHPFYKPQDFSKEIRRIIENPDLQNTMEI